MRKKLLGAVLALLVAVAMLLTGCGGATNSKDTIVVAMDTSYPPMEFVDENNQITGFDAELAKAIGEKLGKKVELKSIAWEGIFIGLETDRYDVIMSSVSITPSRLESYIFTKPYLANGQVIVTRPGDDTVKSVDDLKGKEVGVQTDTTADTACKKKLEEKGDDFFNIRRYDEIIQTFEAMSAGHIDYIVVDTVVATEYATKYPEKYQISTAEPLTNEPIAACFKKDNTALRDEFQKALDELRKDGTLTKISEKWLFGVDYTQNINENLY